MDPSGSELDSSLPLPENPCLIVEDSQPDSPALEDDPESSYRTLLAKRLSNLQPPAPSPVLELISSPLRDRVSPTENQTSGNHNNHALEPDQSLEESSPVFDIVSSGDTKRLAMEDVESGADSTTCAQTEGNMSQFGLLELSESQGFQDESQKSDGRRTAGREAQSQDLRRSEVSSSSKESQRLSIQALLHSQAVEDEDIVSSQEDLFEGEEERAGTHVDSTVNECGGHSMPTSTPANSLHLLHLSGQGTLVQESLSQQSQDFVAATQERMSQAPLIVPNSPTGDEPMDISNTEDNQSQRGQDRPKGSSPVPKPRPTSTPVSQNSPGFVLDKSLPLPSQPEFSHDTFMATPSLEQQRTSGLSSSQTQSPPTAVKTSSSKLCPRPSLHNLPAAAAAAPAPHKHGSTAAQPKPAPPTASSQAPEVGASFQLELSSTSQPSIFFQKTQSFLSDEDEDEDTQIEEPEQEAAGVDASDAGPNRSAAASHSNTSGGRPGPRSFGPGSGCAEREIHRSQPDPARPASQNVNVNRSLSQGSAQAISAKPLGGGLSLLGRVESSAPRPCPTPGVPGGVPSSLPSQSLSQSMLSSHSAQRPVPACRKSQPSSQAAYQTPSQRSQPLSQKSQPQPSSQAASQTPSQRSQPLSQKSQPSSEAAAQTPSQRSQPLSQKSQPQPSSQAASQSPSQRSQPLSQKSQPQPSSQVAAQSPSQRSQPLSQKSQPQPSSQAASQTPSQRSQPLSQKSQPSSEAAAQTPSQRSQPLSQKSQPQPSSQAASQSPSQRSQPLSQKSQPSSEAAAQTPSQRSQPLSQKSQPQPSSQAASQSPSQRSQPLSQKSQPQPSSQVAAQSPSQRSQPLSQSPSQRSQLLSQSPSQHSQPLSQRSQGAAHSQERGKDLGEMDVETGEGKEEGNDSAEGAGASGLCLALSQTLDLEPMEEAETLQLAPGPPHTKGGQTSPGGPSSSQRSQRMSQQRERERERGVSASQPTVGIRSPEKRKEIEKSISPGKGSLSQPERGCRVEPGPHRSQSQGLSDSSGDIPFHFTLPKEGELIRPVVTATPPLISQLKKTPRHSTPIEMTSFSEASEGDVTRETIMADSEIMAEESVEEPATAEASGKLSLRMKLVTPVEEGSSGSERFSLQKPPLSDDDGSVVKATTVAKAVSSPSVFSRVREAHRQEEAAEEAQPSSPSAPLSGGPLNSSQKMGGASQDSRPRPLVTSTQLNSQDVHQSQPLSPSLQRGTVGNGTLGRLSQKANGAASESPLQHGPTGTPQRYAGQSAQVGGSELPLPRTPVKQRAVSQQTSFEAPASTSYTPSKSHQRAFSQQTSFDAAGAQNLSGRGEPELSPPRPTPGVRLRRHVRTIQEVRTTVTRIITDVYYDDGREVDRKVTEESEEPVVDCRVLENDLSPSRTGSSMTSGDLADVSSLSSKASSLAHSSSGSMGTGTGSGRRPDFLMPAGRGAARGGSPRRGRKQLQRPVSEQATVQGPCPLTPVTPRGRSRRGRPPSRSPQSRGGRAGANNIQPAPSSSSPEEEERFTRITTSPPGPSARAGGASSDSSLVGLRVVAKWSSNGYFYSGRITSDLGSGRFRLLFDDGYECEVQGRDVLLCDPIPTETEVTAIAEDEYFCTGMVKGHKAVGRELQYCVEREGQQQWYSRASVILSMEQGSRLREQHGLDPYEPLTPLTKAADISLDNLVEGKRRRRGNTGPGVNTPNRSSSTSNPRTPGPSGKRKLMSSTEEEQPTERTPAKRGRKSGPNKAGLRAAVGTAVSNTSGSDAGDLSIHGLHAGAGIGVCNTSGSGTDVPSDPSDLLTSHGPLPTSDSLFMGFAFLLTAASVNDRLSNLATSDEEEDYLQTAPYNKHYIVSQLEAGGGLVLPDFNEEQCKAAYQSLLIADQHCRTRKFLLCVASGVPCVSNAWVRDCCQEQKLLNYRNYLLPAGLGPDQHVVEWHPRCSPFKALRVLLVFGGSADLWAELLKLTGATSVKQEKGGEDTDIPADTFDVMVTERACPSAVVKRASSLVLPVVSLEWLVQSLIVGERQDYGADPQYRHDYDL